MFEVILDSFRFPGDAFHVREGFSYKILLRTRRHPAMDVGLQVIVQILIGIQLRRVRRQMVQRNLVLMLFYPLCHFFTVMNPKVVNNQEHFPPCVPNKPLHELDHQSAFNAPLVQHETQLAFIADGRYHADTLSLHIHPDDRLPAARCKSPRQPRGRLQPRLITLGIIIRYQKPSVEPMSGFKVNLLCSLASLHMSISAILSTLFLHQAPINSQTLFGQQTAET
jgi:hypothetical protein